MQFLVQRGAEASPSSGQTVVLPAALVVIGQELQEDTPIRAQLLQHMIPDVNESSDASHLQRHFSVFVEHRNIKHQTPQQMLHHRGAQFTKKHT